jgi:ribose/xylose/arabinose/galactoside ABC-type transport system permease subunit
LQFYAIAVAVIGGINTTGGRGSLSGTMMGSAILVIAMNIMQIANMSIWYQTISIGLIILITAVQQAREQYKELLK